MTLGGWLDRQIQRLCDWLEDTFPNDHSLALAGAAVAGTPRGLPLPTDRRWRPGHIHQMAHANGGENADKAHLKKLKGVWDTDSKKYWGYCHMLGYPCVHCGGKNAVRAGTVNPKYKDLVKAATDLCPSGSVGGTAWFGCCFHPVQKRGKLIAFLDCCGGGTCTADPSKWCNNWPGAKDWCAFSGSAYKCTVAVDIQSDATCN